MLLFAFTYSSYNLDFEYFLIITFFCGFFIVEKHCSSSAWMNQWWIFLFKKKNQISAENDAWSIFCRNQWGLETTGVGIAQEECWLWKEVSLGWWRVSENPGPEEAGMQCVWAGSFRSEVFSEWTGRKRGVGMVKQWESLYLNTKPAQNLGGLGSEGENQVFKKCANNEIFLIYFFFNFRDSLWQLLSKCATL